MIFNDGSGPPYDGDGNVSVGDSVNDSGVIDRGGNVGAPRAGAPRADAADWTRFKSMWPTAAATITWTASNAYFASETIGNASQAAANSFALTPFVIEPDDNGRYKTKTQGISLYRTLKFRKGEYKELEN